MIRLHTVDDLATFLDVEKKTLVYYAFRANIDSMYNVYNIYKKNGKLRRIETPNKKLQLLQRNIAKKLYEYYTPRVIVCGFVRNKSIRDNAQPHIGAKWILNLDIENFFFSINFGRVLGLFRSDPFNASQTVATALARLCCYKGHLPVGAPSSPVISNFICRRLDQNLYNVAKALSLKVSRYADDITISSKKSIVPNDLAELNSAGVYEAGQLLKDLIVNNGFTVNNNKFTVRTKYNKQRVTGLIVNRFVNLERSYIKNLWQIIHAWRKFGTYSAASHHFGFTDLRGATTPTEEVFRKKVVGRIMFVRHIRGANDTIYLKMAQSVREIDPEINIPIERDLAESFHGLVWVHDAEGTIHQPKDCFQGTVFRVETLGFCGAHHCVGTAENEIYPPNSTLKYKASMVKGDKIQDWVVLSLDEEYIGQLPPPFKIAKSKPFIGQKIRLLGYPKWGPGSSITVQEGSITGKNLFDGVERFKIDCAIVTGNSGGPIVDEQNRVIGIAVKGNESFSAVGDGENLLIPIQLALY